VRFLCGEGGGEGPSTFPPFAVLLKWRFLVEGRFSIPSIWCSFGVEAVVVVALLVWLPG